MASSPDLREAAERLALVLSGHGLQRMTARVLAALLFSEQQSVTMADLAEELHASSGSISGALKSLTAVGLAERVPAPGSRRDHFRLRPDAWATLYTGQNQTLAAFFDAADAGLAVAARTGLAWNRLSEMRDFYAFLMAEIPALLQRWHDHRGHGQ